MLVVHDWLKEYLGEEAPSAQEIEELLTFHSFEIEGIEKAGEDEIIDVDILPNRSADCLSHRGIAREIAALVGKPLAHDPFAKKPEMPETDKIKITIENPEACRHFDLALISGVEVKESPDWLKRRLEALGQRSINNVVDATNYVMFGLGQPTHVYDADKFKKDGDTWHFGVRMAKAEETVATLGGEEYEVDETIQMIVNEADGTYAGIAGIKGGAYAELNSETKTIILEAGNFNPSITRKASQKLRLQTDASKRFENGVSTNIIPYSIAELARLIVEIAGGELEGFAHARPVDIENQPVAVTLAHMNALIGLTFTATEVEDIFDRLGFTYESTGEGAWTVTAPFERTDINIAVDVIEEVGRVHGYDEVTSVVPETVPLIEYNHRHYYSEKVRDVLIDLGFSEVITSSFRKKDEVQLLNAMASDKSFVRSSLIKNVTEALDKNAGFTDLLGTNDTRIFEIGTVFDMGENTVSEHFSLCLGVRLRPSGYTGKEDKVLNQVLEKLEEALGAKLEPQIEKGVAEINFAKLLEQLPEATAYDRVTPEEGITYTAFSQYPSMSRDIALWVTEEATAEQVEAVLNEQAGPLRVRTTLFDEFTKDGRTSLAFRLVFQSFEKTLTDEEVNAEMDRVYKAVAEKGWEVR
jgi:phenylalanyl-tRNA synthetase beta chain